MPKQNLCSFVGLSICFAAVANAADQGAATPDFPTKTIRIVVPGAPGGSADYIGRLLAQRIGDRVQPPVIVDNRPGAGGNIGTDIVAKSQPDGYTVICANVSSIAINSSLYKNMTFDPVKDLAPITLSFVFPNVIVVQPSFPAKSIKELIALAKAKPDTLTFASAGNGSSTHLGPVLLNTMAGIRMTHVPYKGGGSAALIAVVSGEVSMYFSSVVAATPQIQSGRVSAIAVTSAKRWPTLPSVPTVSESGLPNYEALNWSGVLARAGTPPALLSWWNREVTSILRDKEVTTQLMSQGAQPSPTTREEFARYIRTETEKWAAVVKASGARVD